MKARLRAFGELLRIPNTLTAGADVVAGFLFAGGLWSERNTGLLVVAASCSLYAGRVALNDLCDHAKDARVRPHRPIPSGRITRSQARFVITVLLASGVALAWVAGRQTGSLAVGLVAAIILYDVVLKNTAIAPAMMGLCRAINLAIGMSGVATVVEMKHYVPVGLIWLYVTSLTIFARHETAGGRRDYLVLGTCGMILAAAGQFALALVVPDSSVWHPILVTITIAVVASCAIRAVTRPEPAAIQRAVTTLVLAIVLMDACFAASTRGLWGAGMVAAFLMPAMWLRRHFPVT